MPRRVESERVLVFDLPVRVFHALFALSFVGAWLTADSERWRDLHLLLGYTALVLVVFRLAWGLVGSRHARLAALRPAPRRALVYLRSLVTGRPEHHAGHNPAGSLAIVGMLGLALATSLAGLAANAEFGGEWVAEVHEALATAMLVLVGIHLAGVAVGSLAHRENLPRAMLDGRKRGRPDEGIARPRRIAGVLLAALVAALWSGLVPTPGLDDQRSLTEITARLPAAAQAEDADD